MADLYVFKEAGYFDRKVTVPYGASFPSSTPIVPDDSFANPYWTGAAWVDGCPPAQLSKVGFMDFAYPHLGADLAGVARYGEILTQAKASTSPLVVAAMERYTHASVFEAADVATFLDILVADPGVDLAQAERDAIVNGWPDDDAV